MIDDCNAFFHYPSFEFNKIAQCKNIEFKSISFFVEACLVFTVFDTPTEVPQITIIRKIRLN